MYTQLAPFVVGTNGYFHEPLGAGNQNHHPFSCLVPALGRLGSPLHKSQPELCVCYLASWETGSGVAEGLLWVNISVNFILATTSAQTKWAQLPSNPSILSKGAGMGQTSSSPQH